MLPFWFQNLAMGSPPGASGGSAGNVSLAAVVSASADRPATAAASLGLSGADSAHIDKIATAVSIVGLSSASSTLGDHLVFASATLTLSRGGILTSPAPTAFERLQNNAALLKQDGARLLPQSANSLTELPLRKQNSGLLLKQDNERLIQQASAYHNSYYANASGGFAFSGTMNVQYYAGNPRIGDGYMLLQDSSATSGSSQGNNYYVAPVLSSGTGTLDNPFGLPDLLVTGATLVSQGPALTVLQPGDTLYFRGGDYHITGLTTGSSYNYQMISPVRSGTSLAPITLSAYPGETVNIHDDGGTQPCMGTSSPLLDHVRFLGFSMFPGICPAFYIQGNHNEVGYCEVTGAYRATTDNHEGIRVDNADGAWIHHNDLHGVSGDSANSAQLKMYGDINCIIEDNYAHDGTTGLYTKATSLAILNGNSKNTFRRNYVKGMTEDCLKGNQDNFPGNPAGDYWYDNVADGTGCNYPINIDARSIGDQIYNNFIIAGHTGGYAQTIVGSSNQSQISVYNNIELALGDTHFLPWNDGNVPLSALSYFDYNIYDTAALITPPGGQAAGAGYHASDGWFTLQQVKSAGYENNSQVTAASNIFVDQVSYALKPAFQTAGKDGGMVGPRCGIAAILNLSRYGPSAYAKAQSQSAGRILGQGNRGIKRQSGSPVVGISAVALDRLGIQGSVTGWIDNSLQPFTQGDIITFGLGTPYFALLGFQAPTTVLPQPQTYYVNSAGAIGVSAAASKTGIFSYPVSVAATLTLTPAPAESLGAFASVAASTAVGLSAAPVAGGTFARSVSVAANLGLAVAPSASLGGSASAIAATTVGLSDAPVCGGTFARSVSAAANLGLAAAPSEALGGSASSIVSTSVGLSDAPVATGTFTRSLAASVNLGISAAPSAALGGSASSTASTTVGLSDAPVSTGIFARSVAAAANLGMSGAPSAALGGSASAVASASLGLSVAPSATGLFTYSAAASDTIHVQAPNSQGVNTDFFVNVQATLSLQAAPLGGGTFFRLVAAADTLGISGANSSAVGALYSVAVSPVLGLAGVAGETGIFAKLASASDSLGLADANSAAVGAAYSVAASSGIGLSGTPLELGIRLASVAASLGLSDANSSAVGAVYGVAASTILGLVDTPAKTGVFTVQASAADSLAFSDANAAGIGTAFSVAATANLALSAPIQSTGFFTIDVSESLGLSDVATSGIGGSAASGTSGSFHVSDSVSVATIRTLVGGTADALNVSVTASSTRVPYDLPPIPGRDKGRRRRGDRVVLDFTTEGVPDEAPILRIFDPNGIPVKIVKIAATSSEGRSFAYELLVGSEFIPGQQYIASIFYRYAGFAYSSSMVFTVVPGGDAGGSILSLLHYNRPEGSYMLAQLESGQLVQGRNPQL